MQNKNKTVVKSMNLLNLFRNYSKLSLGEMVQLSGIPKTSVHRMVGLFENIGFQEEHLPKLVKLVKKAGNEISSRRLI